MRSLMILLAVSISLLIQVSLSPRLYGDENVIKARVLGAACRACTRYGRILIGRIDGVASVRQNLREGTITVYAKSGAQVDKKEIEKAIRNSGYTFVGFVD